jgi:hypothetical protein
MTDGPRPARALLHDGERRRGAEVQVVDTVARRRSAAFLAWWWHRPAPTCSGTESRRGEAASRPARAPPRLAEVPAGWRTGFAAPR